jgi:hypothetical protein
MVAIHAHRGPHALLAWVLLVLLLAQRRPAQPCIARAVWWVAIASGRAIPCRHALLLVWCVVLALLYLHHLLLSWGNDHVVHALS